MIEIGKYSELKIMRNVSVGLFLADRQGEEVLLPRKYCPENPVIGDLIEVFVYLDHNERKIATNLSPGIVLNEFALLKVIDVSNVGAFLDWGLEKDLMVPFSEQRQKMEVDRWYIVYLYLDEESNRLIATNKLDRYLQNETLNVTEGEEVELIVMSKTDLGYSVIVNNEHKGLIYSNEVFKPLNVGDRLPGYVKKIREENKLDISVHPLGYTESNEANTGEIIIALKKNKGFIAVTDKSSPDEIYSRFGISKKAFKKAIGSLYKQKKITIEEEGIRILKQVD